MLFHVIGLAGILFFDRKLFADLTPVNLLLMLLLLIWTQQGKNLSFFLFMLLCFIAGYAVEYAGVTTGSFFGEYSYGTTLGFKLLQVPLVIPINWFIIVYCCGILVNTLLVKAISRISSVTGTAPMRLKVMSVVVDGATLAVFFDWIMEPVAVKLGFWQWKDNENIPLLNYISWFVVSMLLMMVFYFFNFSKQNKFAIHLLLIQLMFFLLLRTIL